MSDYRIGGWRHDLEKSSFLLFSSVNGGQSISQMLRDKMWWDPPPSVDPRGWLQIEDQQQLGSCEGHANSTACELAYYFEAGEPIQFSRMFAYIMAQRKDGIQGDNGATVSGGVRTAKEDGLCLESTWPYTGRYSTQIPQAATEEAKDYKVRTSVRCASYDDVFTFLAAGIGGINVGMMWGLPDAGVIEEYRAGGGGHAVSWVGYSERKDPQSRNYIIMANSWGRRWGASGFAELSPRCVEGALAHRFTECYGLSDMVNIEPRKIRYEFL